ncbi:hypothetical protein LSTR_LSTR010203 [Laodelphax striatellus]|uniref:Uncharacterized protein n=1 Tax=Laodelphax striatellus TaxID=195883 RepID=A0A482WQJ0_LAOST|nr:hypothetical protein LSTR_LSTR010203 [Laodelphax striatellus]
MAYKISSEGYSAYFREEEDGRGVQADDVDDGYTCLLCNTSYEKAKIDTGAVGDRAKLAGGWDDEAFIAAQTSWQQTISPLHTASNLKEWSKDFEKPIPVPFDKRTASKYLILLPPILLYSGEKGSAS